MRNLVLVLVVLLLAFTLLPAWADGDGEGTSGWEGILPDPAQDQLEDDEAWPEFFVCRILDAETRAPIPGARWIRTPEWCAPWRLHHDAILSVGVADRDGIAHLPSAPEAWRHDCHWLVSAPGYATAHDYDEVPGTEVLLERGVPFRGRVLDPLGRPVAGATVEILGGCSHGTAAARATADADGRFLMPRVPSDLPGQIWIEGRGIASDLIALSSPDALGRGEVALWMKAGERHEGQVVDLIGRPVQGVVVRAWNAQRGPTAMTDALGHFVIDGVESRSYALSFYPPADLLEGDGGRFVEDMHPGVPARIVVTPVGIPEAETNARILVRAHDEKGRPVPDLSLAAIEIATGRGPGGVTAEKEEGTDDPPVGTTLLEVVPGTYRLVPDEPFDAFTFDAEEVEVRAHERAIVDVTARPRPRLEIEGGIPDDAGLFLAVPGAQTAAEGEGATWSPPLPADGPAALRVEIKGRPPFAFPVGPVQGGLRRVVVSLPTPRRIQLPAGARHVVLLDGPRTAFHTPLRDGWIASDARGPLVLWWRDKDGEEYEARVVLPMSGDAAVRVEEIVPRETPGEWVAVRRPGWRTLWRRAGREGDGQQPYGPATLRLLVRDEDGPVDALVLVAGEVQAAPEGVLELRGFPEGPLRIVVGRRGVLGPGREIHVDLREAASQETLVVLSIQ